MVTESGPIELARLRPTGRNGAMVASWDLVAPAIPTCLLEDMGKPTTSNVSTVGEVFIMTSGVRTQIEQQKTLATDQASI